MSQPLQLPYCATLHHTQPCLGQAFAEEFCEILFSSLVTKKGQNRGAVTIDDVDDLHQLICIREGGHRVNVCKIPNSLVNPCYNAYPLTRMQRVCTSPGLGGAVSLCAQSGHIGDAGV